MKENIKFIIGIAIGVILLFLFFREADFGKFKDSLKEANYGIITIIILLILFSYVIRGFRWQYLLLPIKKTKIPNLISTTVIGFTITTLLPGRLGELARPYLLGIKEKISKSAALATVVVERLFDFITIFSLFSIYLLLKPAIAGNTTEEKLNILNAYRKGGIIGLSICMGLMVFLIIIHLKTHWFQSLIDKFTSRLPEKIAKRITRPLKSFIEGLVVLDLKRNLPYIIIYSLALWLLISFSYWLGMIAFGIRLPFYYSLLFMTAAAIGAVTPTPSGAGGYHLACQICLVMFFEIPANTARAIATVMHATSFFPVTILGIIFIWVTGLSLSKIRKLSQERKNINA